MMHNPGANLAADLRQREPAAWCGVYDAHAREVFGFVYHSVSGNRLTAEEICQEAWLAGIDRIEQFDESRGTFRSWLFAIVRQRVALHFRKVSGKEAKFTIRDEDCLHQPDGAVLPEEALEQIERTDAVRAAMLLLAEDRRDALTAKYIDGLSVEEIAVRTGRTAKAIESLLTRARAQMRSLLQWYSASPDGPRPKEPSDDRSTVS
jgi:RNA polymerase sigma-70 factor, ECF subfamily